MSKIIYWNKAFFEEKKGKKMKKHKVIGFLLFVMPAIIIITILAILQGWVILEVMGLAVGGLLVMGSMLIGMILLNTTSDEVDNDN